MKQWVLWASVFVIWFAETEAYTQPEPRSGDATLEARFAELQQRGYVAESELALAELIRAQWAGQDTLQLRAADLLMLQSLVYEERSRVLDATAASRRSNGIARALEAAGQWDQERFELVPELRSYVARAYVSAGTRALATGVASDSGDAHRTLTRALYIAFPLLAPGPGRVPRDHAATYAAAAAGLAGMAGERRDTAEAMHFFDLARRAVVHSRPPDPAVAGSLLLRYAHFLSSNHPAPPSALPFVRALLPAVADASFQEQRPAADDVLSAADTLTSLHDFPAARFICNYLEWLGRSDDGGTAAELVVKALVCKGRIAMTLGDNLQARVIFARADVYIETARAVSDSLRAAVALGNAYSNWLDGEFEGAEPYLRRAFSLIDRLGPAGTDLLRDALGLEAGIFAYQGRTLQALSAFEELSEAIYQQQGNTALEYLVVKNQIAALQLQAGLIAQARRTTGEIIGLLEDSPADIGGLATNAVSAAGILMHPQIRESAAASEILLRIAPRLQNYLRTVLPGLTRAEAIEFLGTTLFPYASMMVQASVISGDIGAFYEFFGGWKGTLVHELSRQTTLASLEGDKATSSLVREYRQALSALAVLHERSLGGDSTSLLQAMQQTEVVEELERRLSLHASGILSDRWSVRGEFGLQRRLVPGEAFVDLYFVPGWVPDGDEAHYVAIITTSEMGPRVVDLGSAMVLDSAAVFWRYSVVSNLPAGRELRALVELAWVPIADALPRNTRRVWLSPDRELARVPWGYLAASYDASSHVQLTQVVSGRHLLSRSLQSERLEGQKVLIVGAVDFGAPGGGSSVFDSLPGTRRELTTIAPIAVRRGFTVTSLSGGLALESEVVRQLPSARYIHLATHGFFSGGGHEGDDGTIAAADALTWLSRRNPLVETGLAFAAANEDAATGRLTAEELLGLDLRQTELVVLSACETGLGNQFTGQGVMGLQASFTAAGARTLLISLWKVPDGATALLMEQFYHGLWELDMTPVEALAHAQSVIRRTPMLQNPFNWAGWVLVGDAW